jgi:hypothetical protein
MEYQSWCGSTVAVFDLQVHHLNIEGSPTGTLDALKMTDNLERVLERAGSVSCRLTNDSCVNFAGFSLLN